MTPEEQRIAIAEACGWTQDDRGWIRPDGIRNEYNEALDVSYRVVQLGPPNYLNDLNAIHNAEKLLTVKQWETYSNKLMVAVRDSDLTLNGSNIDARYKSAHATSSQRSEAFLQVIGKWKK